MGSRNILEESTRIPSSSDSYEITFCEDVDSGFRTRFVEYCIEHGIIEKHAQLFMDFLSEEQEHILNYAQEEAEEALRVLWGNRYRKNINRARQAVIALDRRMEGRLIPFFKSGYGNNAILIEMLSIIGTSIEEDAIAMPAKGYSSDKAMSTEEFLTKVVFK